MHRLFDMNLSAAVLCIKCGYHVIQDLSLFEICRSGNSRVVCDCGKVLMKIRSSDGRRFQIAIPCDTCGVDHLYSIHSRQVLSQKVKFLTCPSMCIDLAYIGNQNLVRDMVYKQAQDLEELMHVLEG